MPPLGAPRRRTAPLGRKRSGGRPHGPGGPEVVLVGGIAATYTITVAPLTRTIRGVLSEVVVGVESGMKSASAINLHHVVTVPKAGLRRFVGSVSPAILENVRAALLCALGFD